MDPRQQIRTYLDILSEQGFVMPTEQEYYQYVQNFKAGNANIDYAVRNLAVLDDEQTRITDDYEAAKDQDQLDVWANKWKPQLGDREIGMIQNALETNPNWEDAVRDILEPYISNKDLYHAHDAYWDEIFFSGGAGLSYEDFVVDAEESGL